MKKYFSSEFKNCVKVEVAALDSPSLTVPMVSVDKKQHWTKRNGTLAQSSGAV